MDPNAAYKRIIELAKSITEGNSPLEYNDLRRKAEELAEKFITLDEWLSKGGFKPKPWNIHF